MNENATNGSAAELVAGSADAVSGLAVFGKTAAALALVIGLILLLSYLVRRFSPGGMAPRHLKLISSLAVGNKERVVIVSVQDTWLVLGVGGGHVNKLHELPAREDFHSQLEAANRSRTACAPTQENAPLGGQALAEQTASPLHSRTDCAPTDNGNPV